jgi:predicted esterase
MTTSELGFVHRFVPAAEPSAPTLLLLHGTGGSEEDLLPLGRLLRPGAALLSPRGRVLEDGMPRFFRRFAEGVFDLDDLRRRAHELADFVVAAASAYGFNKDGVIAAGYSNGANIAAAMMLLRPETLHSAVLWHAQVPLEPEPRPSLSRHSALITAGRRDPVVAPTETERLRDLLAECGAAVQLAWVDGGHALTQEDVDIARKWLQDVGRAFA